MATLVWRRRVGSRADVLGRRREVYDRTRPASAVRLDSAYVSKRHAVIRASGGGFTIADLGSSNGTRVNGAPDHDCRR